MELECRIDKKHCRQFELILISILLFLSVNLNQYTSFLLILLYFHF